MTNNINPQPKLLSVDKAQQSAGLYAANRRRTDIGTRTIMAIGLDGVDVAGTGHGLVQTLNRAQAESERWFSGPPYAVPEHVFDEDDKELARQRRMILNGDKSHVGPHLRPQYVYQPG